MERIEQELAHCVEEGRRNVQQGHISVDFLLSLRRHEAYLLSQQSHGKEQLRKIEEEIERRRIALMEADREVKVLEKLKDKMKTRHDQAESLAELKQMDETAGRSVPRKGN